MKRNEIWIGLIALGIGALGMWFIQYQFFNSSGVNDSAHQHHAVESEEASVTWTCSMHPQIRQDEPGLCPICEMDLIPAESMASDNPLQLTMTETAVKLSQLETQRVEFANPGQLQSLLALTGEIREDLDGSGVVNSLFPGTVQKLHIKSPGEKVAESSLIAEVFSPELRSTQLELLRAHELRESRPELFQSVVKKMEVWEIDSTTVERIISRGSPIELWPVRASQGGTVTELMVSEGDYINRGAGIMRIANFNRLWVEFIVNESDLGKVNVGDEVIFNTLAHPDRKERITVYYIDPEVDAQKRTAVVRGRVYNSNNRLRPRMQVRGHLRSTADKSTDNQLIVPTSAVLWTGKRSVVYVQIPDQEVPTYEYREVEIVEIQTDHTIISSGLEVGEEVVIRGAFTVDAVAQLNNQRSMMNQMVNTDLSPVSHRMEVNPYHLEKFEVALNFYLELKDQLVLSDEQTAAQTAEKIGNSLKEIPPVINDPEVSEKWESRQLEAENAAHEIANSDDLEIQRGAFEKLSMVMIFWLRHFELSENVVYVQNCPMAFDNEGADWVSNEKQIRNPYFGDRMLRCGTVVEVID